MVSVQEKLLAVPLVALWFLVGCGDGDHPRSVDESTPYPITGTNLTSVYSCPVPDGDGFTFTTSSLNMNPGELALWLPPRFDGRSETLVREEESGGLRYAAEGILLELRGGAASLSVDGQVVAECQRDGVKSVWEHAKVSGVDFRATGNEPGWHLEIRDDLETAAGKRIRFVYDYGEGDVVLHSPDPEFDEAARRTVYHGESGDLEIRLQIEENPCSDTMSGEQFEATVTVEFRGRIYRGCGRALH
jgi:putative lipoprotein